MEPKIEVFAKLNRKPNRSHFLPTAHPYNVALDDGSHCSKNQLHTLTESSRVGQTDWQTIMLQHLPYWLATGHAVRRVLPCFLHNAAHVCVFLRFVLRYYITFWTVLFSCNRWPVMMGFAYVSWGILPQLTYILIHMNIFVFLIWQNKHFFFFFGKNSKNRMHQH